MEEFVKSVSMFFIILLALTSLAYPNQAVKLTDTPSGATLLSQDQFSLTLRVDVGELNFTDISTASGQFLLLTVEGLGHSENVGEPDLPVLNKLISIPYGCDLQYEIIDSQSEEISLADFNLVNPLMPVQPPLSKGVDPSTVPFEYNQGLYEKSGYYAIPRASAEIVGFMRAMRLGLISVAPIEYNPLQKSLRVYKSITVRVNYLHPDWAATRAAWQRLDSPAFTPVYEQIYNYDGQQSMLLDDHTRYPITYLIVSHRMFEAQLQPFIEWKTRRGFKVITAYTDSIGTTNTAIRSYIQTMYNSEDPAPSFVLLVGDAQQIPPFPFSGHISDLSFCEFTGDNIPEIYYGRFSAQNTTQLQPQIDKTLEYEQYLMPDPTYLGEATMIAGVDGNYAQVWANGQINYGTTYYFNAEHGIHSNTWLYPASNGPVEAAIIATVNQGVSYINYTAHGSHDGWADPAFSTSNVNSLTNAHKYCLSVGNCCQTNTFGTDYGTPCMGEAWLQGANKGAIGYIGASDYSYWDEDYFWGVGFRSNIVEHPTYDATRLGAYDGAFHTRGEPVAKHYLTNDAMLFCGNLAVQQSNSSMKAYYWQVYNLMGDPSTMTYFGVPIDNTVTHSGTMMITDDSYSVQADPGSYVGISINGVLHGAAYVDSSGTVDVALTPFDEPGTADIVVTAQNRIPYTGTIQVITPSGPYVIYDSSTVNDASGNNDGLIDCGEHIVLGVRLKNVGPDTAYSVTATLACPDSCIALTDNSESYGDMPGDNGLMNRASAFAFDVSGRTPDNHNITLQLTMTDNASHTWNSTFVLRTHAPNLTYVSMVINDSTGNNNGVLDPGETALLVVTLQNGGSGQALSVTGVMSESDPYVNLNDADGAFGDIMPGGNGNNSADVFVIHASGSCPMGYALNLNLALNATGGYATQLLVPMLVGDRSNIYVDDFSTDQGWTGLGGAGEWTIGPATGGAGSDGYGGPDADVDHSPSDDNMVLGNDLTPGTGGDYSANLSQTYYATSPTIDCSNYTSVQLSFYRWLGVERNQYDHAYLQAYNGASWVTVYQNDSNTLDESQWSEQQYDLTATADGNANFQIRFGIGGTDASWQYCGWNIDDIIIKGYLQGPPPNPDLDFSVTSLTDTLAQEDSLSRAFKIYNRGTADLNITFSCTAEWLGYSGDQITVAANDSAVYTVIYRAAGLGPGLYITPLSYTSNDTDQSSGYIPVNMQVTPRGCDYVMGDINGNNMLNGLDVTFGVAYLKGGSNPPYTCECTPGNTWFVSGDVNGSCDFNGLDISYMVLYFKGGPLLQSCADCPPGRSLVPRLQPPAPAIIRKSPAQSAQ
jgi:hypothetical protein